jgi:hypothetical protein
VSGPVPVVPIVDPILILKEMPLLWVVVDPAASPEIRALFEACAERSGELEPLLRGEWRPGPGYVLVVLTAPDRRHRPFALRFSLDDGRSARVIGTLAHSTTDCLIRLFPCEHQRSRAVEALRALDADAVRQLGVGVAALETASLATAA